MSEAHPLSYLNTPSATECRDLNTLSATGYRVTTGKSVMECEPLYALQHPSLWLNSSAALSFSGEAILHLCES